MRTDKRGKGYVQPEPPRHSLELPAAEVAAMSRAERVARVGQLVDRAQELVDCAVTELGRDKQIVARAVLFSGGNDSTTLLHLMRELGIVTHAIHANTGIGIEDTRRFVREVVANWGIPLIEERPPVSYEELVLTNGFPGPAHHYKMYQRLKERCLDQARKPLGVHRSRTLRALYIAGRRREESERRSDVPLYEPDGSVIWVSPFAEWTKLDLNTYRSEHDVPHNRVADLVHMSGECGCGSFAKEDELEMIGDWFPEFRAEVERLEALIAHRTDIPAERRKWGWGAYRGRARPPRRMGRLCSSCNVPRNVGTARGGYGYPAIPLGRAGSVSGEAA
ncbi:phosphoadenosine phosphosulfate reductase family protein [Amycolatopsis cynarae]|uniref:Phosphoadenosine phosphosulfate reductase family protein n=1 Tax=Amycolatopsis cynarae TaxID=2995223 RepID=A0ABY7B4J2_9PSEU|nr:phosphoadenosine phosphosulfate reductase family protein [Amycolatopsis sp. HUAS 11-8]WAL67101.1 phosphoadenosine phosphosulfate reductase family protein [Amycolatopsis sp. HUAS 11-8]